MHIYNQRKQSAATQHQPSIEERYDHVVSEILNHRQLDNVLKKQLKIWMELINQEKELL